MNIQIDTVSLSQSKISMENLWASFNNEGNRNTAQNSAVRDVTDTRQPISKYRISNIQ